jgi:hypothetical protein
VFFSGAVVIIIIGTEANDVLGGNLLATTFRPLAFGGAQYERTQDLENKE